MTLKEFVDIFNFGGVVVNPTPLELCDDNFIKAFNKIDFKKISKCMKIYDWSYWNTKGTPTENELKSVVLDLYFNMNGNYVSSGGFTIEKDGNNNYCIAFTL